MVLKTGLDQLVQLVESGTDAWPSLKNRNRSKNREKLGTGDSTDKNRNRPVQLVLSFDIKKKKNLLKHFYKKKIYIYMFDLQKDNLNIKLKSVKLIQNITQH